MHAGEVDGAGCFYWDREGALLNRIDYRGIKSDDV